MRLHHRRRRRAQPSLPRVCVLLQALSERTTCAEDQRLDRGRGEPNLGRVLAVCEPLPLPQKNRAPLVLRHLLEDILQADQLVGDLFTSGDDFLEHLEVVRCLDLATAPRGAPPREAHVVRDLEQPGGFELGDDPTREPAEGIHERRLDGVLRLLARAELVEAVAEDLSGVALIEVACSIGPGSERSLDAGCPTYGWFCGHLSSCCGYERSARRRS